MNRQCDECPWRTDVPVGRFPPERYEALSSSVEQGFGNKMFACHKSPEDNMLACVGYVMNQLEVNIPNFELRMALADGKIDPDKMQLVGPQYETFEQMAEANGWRKKRK
jgi:uncharacterized protein DUF6283